jgi:phage replication-related protein YjqB (UPF0714/DUF867 family)
MKISFFIMLLMISLPGFSQQMSSFKELIIQKKEGRDFEIKTRSVAGNILIMAIHGGMIEPGTTELASAIAAEKFSFYSFIGLTDDYSGLHLSSTNFDEPRLLELMKTAEICLSLHGLKDDEADFCIGGAQTQKRKAFVKLLTSKFPKWRTCELCCPPNSGTSKKNVVNRCKQDGVQIEMGQSLRLELKRNPVFLKALSQVLQVEISKN